MRVEFELNGKAISVESSPDTPLLWVLRDQLDLPGTKFGCGKALCGACTVHVNGEAVRSCSFPIRFASGKKVKTIEGLEDDAVGRAVIASWIELDVVQCGWCQPGQCMAAAALLAQEPEPTDEDIDASMSGNLCRCGTYPRIREAIHGASARLAFDEPGDEEKRR
jgi:isoquinoline 1-oxidoreductase alpha subunit